MQFLAWSERVVWGTFFVSFKLANINIVLPSRLNKKELLWHRIHFLSELYERSRFINSSESLLEFLVAEYCKKFAPCLAPWWISLLKIPVNQLVMRKLLDGKSSTASKWKTSLWKCPFVLEFIFHLKFLLAFLANVLIFFKCLKVNESHILFSQAPRCESFRVKGE